MTEILKDRKLRIKRKVRGKIIGKTDFLRLSVYRSNKYIYAQVIDDIKKVTVVAENDLKLSLKNKITKRERAKEVGLALAKKLQKMKVKQLVFDRGHYTYGGRIKALAEGVREEGIKI